MTKRTDQERQYKCGYCGARPGQACLSPRGKHHNVYHQDRVNRRIDAEAETLDPEETLAGLDEDARVVVAELGEEGSTMSRIASGACALTRPGKRPRYVRSTTVDDLRRRMVVTTIRNSPPAYGLTGHGRRVAQAARDAGVAGEAPRGGGPMSVEVAKPRREGPRAGIWGTSELARREGRDPSSRTVRAALHLLETILDGVPGDHADAVEELARWAREEAGESVLDQLRAAVRRGVG